MADALLPGGEVAQVRPGVVGDHWDVQLHNGMVLLGLPTYAAEFLGCRRAGLAELPQP